MDVPVPGVNPFKDIRVIISLIGTLIIGLAVFFGVGTILAWKAGAEMNEQRGAKIETTVGAIGDSVAEQKVAAEQDAGVIGAKHVYGENFNAQYQSKNDFRRWADEPRPVVLHDLAKKRRLARERFGRDIERDQDASETPDTE